MTLPSGRVKASGTQDQFPGPAQDGEAGRQSSCWIGIEELKRKYSETVTLTFSPREAAT